MATELGTETAVLFLEKGDSSGFEETSGFSTAAPTPSDLRERISKVGASDPQGTANELQTIIAELGAPFTGQQAGFSEQELLEWLVAHKTGVYYILMSPEYYEREFFKQKQEAVAFSDFLRLKNSDQAEFFWRRIVLELWVRAFVDPASGISAGVGQNVGGVTEANLRGSATEPAAGAEKLDAEKLDIEPNPGKNLDIEVAGSKYRRYPLRTKSITRGDALEDYVVERLKQFFETSGIDPDSMPSWRVFIAEKIVAITQTRSFFVWEIEPGWWARKLSARITPSSYGYGLSIPWTMELAIREVGLPRILLASAGSVLGKLFGKAGWFYIIAGAGVRAIDGPLESPVYPSYLSAKLAPNNTNAKAKSISRAIREGLSADAVKNFSGTVIIDANDVGQHILGKDVDESDEILGQIFADNPLGQGGERTPIAIVVRG